MFWIYYESNVDNTMMILVVAQLLLFYNTEFPTFGQKISPMSSTGLSSYHPMHFAKEKKRLSLFITWYKRHKNCYNLTMLTAEPLSH